MRKSLYDRLCDNLVAKLNWIREQSEGGFVHYEEEDKETSFSLHFAGNAIELRIYTNGENLNSVYWTDGQRQWMNKITGILMPSPINKDPEAEIYEELCTKTRNLR